MEQSNTKIFLLTCTVMFHTLFMMACIIFVFTYSFLPLYNNKSLDFMVLCIAISFIVFKKCILIDVYNYIKNLDNIKDELNILPDIAKDNYFRNKIKLFFTGEDTGKDTLDYTPYRLDILQNVEPMFKILDKQLHQNMYNHKVHYLIANIILIIILLHKYNLEKLIPLFIAWILSVFKL